MKKAVLSATDIDFLAEMLSIGIGNALATLSDFCAAEVNLNKPITLVSDDEICKTYLAAAPITCTRIDFKGDLNGIMLFLIKVDQMKLMTNLIENSFLRQFGGSSAQEDMSTWEPSMIEELANVFAGRFFATIHKFARLNVDYDVPVYAVSTFSEVFEELNKENGTQSEHINLVSELNVGNQLITIAIVIALASNIGIKISRSVKGAREYMVA